MPQKRYRQKYLQKNLVLMPKGLGDSIFASGVLAQLMADEPQAAFHLICMHVGSAQLFAAAPQVAAIHCVQYRYNKSHWPHLLRIGWAHRWHRVVDMRRTVFTRLLWARHRHRFQQDDRLHKVEQCARMFGYQPPPAPRIWLGEAQTRAAAGLPQPLLAVSPSSNWLPKNWPVEKFIAALQALTAPGGPLPQAVIAVHGVKGEPSWPHFQAAFAPERLLNLTGQPLDKAAASFLRTRLLLTNDSGLGHVAAALKTPVLALFGPKSEARFRPWGEHVRTVRGSVPHEVLDAQGKRNPKASAMGDLEVPAVVAAARDLLAATQARRAG